MIIKSDFRDYYDSFQIYGDDLTFIFYRKSYKSKSNHNCYRMAGAYDVTVIYFCGKRYIAFIKYDLGKICDVRYNLPDEFWGNSKSDVKYRKEMFDLFIKRIPTSMDAPIVVVRYAYFEEIITINDCLHQYNFGKMVNPFDAFNELYHWHSNKANPEKPLPEIDDITMRDIKGFDKYSFKKQKQRKI
jgi:hypothetical protein